MTETELNLAFTSQIPAILIARCLGLPVATVHAQHQRVLASGRGFCLSTEIWRATCNRPSVGRQACARLRLSQLADPNPETSAKPSAVALVARQSRDTV